MTMESSVSSVQPLSYVQLFVTPWTVAYQASLSPTPGACSNSCPVSWWYHPTISSSVVPFSCLQSFSASRYFPISQFFALGSQSIGFSFSIGASNEQSGLISFRMDWFDLVVQGTLKSLLQHYNLKACGHGLGINSNIWNWVWWFPKRKWNAGQKTADYLLLLDNVFPSACNYLSIHPSVCLSIISLQSFRA